MTRLEMLKEADLQAQAAFNHAIRTGRLNEMTARDYMFMGFDAKGRAAFKHRLTRAYLSHDTRVSPSK